MTLVDRIQQEIKTAMLARNADRLGTLRLLKSAVGYAQIERNNDRLPDGEVVAIVQKEIKKRRDAIEQYAAGGRPDLAAREAAEITVLESFLPQPLSAEELEQMIRAILQESGATTRKEMGSVIKAVQAKAAGRADGRTISAAVGRLLA
jgi:uncharacterized protein YqeY